MKIKLFLLLLIIFAVSAPLFGLDRVMDFAGLLSAAEAANLKELLDKTSLAYDFDMVVVSVRQTGNTEPMDFAAGFFNSNGYGLGENRDGCLLLVVTDMKVFWFGTSGKGKKILTSSASKKLEKETYGSLQNGNFYDAFVAYTRGWEELLILDAKGRTYNFLYKYNLVFVILAWVVSLVTGLIIVGVWKKGMDTAIPKKQAVSYITPGSLSFAVQQEKFIYSIVTKIERGSDLDEDEDEDGDAHASSPKKTKAGNSEDESKDEGED